MQTKGRRIAAICIRVTLMVSALLFARQCLAPSALQEGARLYIGRVEEGSPSTERASPKSLLLKQAVVKKYELDKDKARSIVWQVFRETSGKVFPKPEHVLAIIGIESSFNPKAQNGRHLGLMQVQEGLWGSREELLHSGTNIKKGIEILEEYYRLTGSIEGALISYNAGIGKYQRGQVPRSTWRYLRKFNEELAYYSGR